MKPVDGNITTDFFDPRPLSKPPEKRDHVHGAIDIGAASGSPIRMPELGTVWLWAAFRSKGGMVWPETPTINGEGNPFCNYFYDTFGGVIICRSADEKRTHVITHCFIKQMFNGEDRGYSIEQPGKMRFPIHGIYSEKRTEYAGAVIGRVGNAGFSTGSHAHWEIHTSNRWQRWENRINPERWEV